MMNSDKAFLRIMMQAQDNPQYDSNASGSINTDGEIVELSIPNGERCIVEITDETDINKVKKLKPLVEQGDYDAVWELAKIIEPYDYIVAALIIIYSAGEAGAGLCMMGEGFEEDPNISDTLAFRAYEHSAKANNTCGMCHLGRCYAEGKGCKKNLRLAKKWFSEAAKVCPDAEKYLDEYGLR